MKERLLAAGLAIGLLAAGGQAVSRGDGDPKLGEPMPPSSADAYPDAPEGYENYQTEEFQDSYNNSVNQLIPPLNIEAGNNSPLNAENVTELPLLPSEVSEPTEQRTPSWETNTNPTTRTPQALLPEISIPEEDGHVEYRLEEKVIEFTSVPEEVEKIIASETLYMGCSGSLVRDESGNVLGGSTAEHCGFRGNQQPRITGTDGQKYMVRPYGKEIKTGADLDNMETVATAKQLILPAEDDTAHDLAFVVADGATPEDVLKNYRYLSAKEIGELNRGETVYLGGYPADQDNNDGPIKRQAFATQVLGEETITLTSGETMKVITTVMRSSADGAECSFGNSGGMGFVMREVVQQDGTVKNVPISVGTLAGFNELKPDTFATPDQAAAARAYYEYKYNVVLPEDAAAVCSFEYAVPSPENGGEVVNLVDSYEQIPGYIDGLKQKAREAFLNPEVKKDVIEGYIPTSTGESKDGYDLLKNPAIYIDTQSWRAILTARDPSQPDELLTIDFGDYWNIRVYDEVGTGTVEVISTSGALSPSATEQNFTDENGLEIGEIITDETSVQIDFDKSYYLYMNQKGDLTTHYDDPTAGGKGGVVAAS